ncbi:MAG: CinA family protein [Gammaproteobacteria bacterium]
MVDFYTEISKIATELAISSLKSGKVLATAESCTGGWLAKSLTDIAGSSEWFDSGFVTYSNESKISMISVAKSTLETHGAVSEAVVIEMAKGILANTNATLSVAISGIAGPGGGTIEKPVGLVWFAFANDSNTEIMVVTEKHVFKGDRNAVRAQAVIQALNGLVKLTES